MREAWSPEGVKVLGTPVGTREFVEKLSNERIAEEQELLEALAYVPDLQCAWQILLQCAGPRCHYFVRTLPPSLSEAYAKAHDTAMWAAVERLLGALPGSASEIDMAKQLSTLPLRLGGLGLRSAERMAPAA